MGQRSFRVASGLVLTCAGMLLLLGCGGPSAPTREYAEVSGIVKLKGNTLTKGSIVFQPPSGAPVIAQITASGTYSLRGVIGSNVVMIKNPTPAALPTVTEDFKKNKAAQEEYDKSLNENKVAPDRYATAASGLAFQVERGKNQADFDLE